MLQKPIADFTATELWVVRSTLKERYERDAAIAVLQVEADHIRTQKTKIDNIPAQDYKTAPDKPDLSPLFWGN